jgi:malate dehydrogenase (oxaloacetate-decarboxylating)(NADP+)
LIGVSTIAGAFDEAVVKRMAALNPRPVIMPLSNPTPLAECTFEQAVSWTNGEVVFASGSPFPPLRRAGGETLYPAQANNAYVFPALGHAAVLSNAREVSDDAFLDCAYELASMSTAECVATGKLFPDFDSIRDVSKKLVASVAAKMEARGETRERVGGIEAWVAKVGREFWCPEADDAPVARSRL